MTSAEEEETAIIYSHDFFIICLCNTNLELRKYVKLLFCLFDAGVFYLLYSFTPYIVQFAANELIVKGLDWQLHSAVHTTYGEIFLFLTCLVVKCVDSKQLVYGEQVLLVIKRLSRREVSSPGIQRMLFLIPDSPGPHHRVGGIPSRSTCVAVTGLLFSFPQARGAL